MTDQAAIHDQTYRHWEGTLRTSQARWWTIAWAGTKLVIRRKIFLLLVLGPPTIHFLVRAAQIYAFHQLRIMPLGPIGPQFFHQFLMGQSFFLVIFCIFVGSGLIAHDLRDRALQFYLSKPVTRLDYVLGKLTIVLLFLAFVTLIPGLLLFILELSFGDAGEFLRNHYWLLGSIIGFSLMLTLPLGLMILALSSLTHNGRYAAIGFAAIGMFSPVLAEMLRATFRSAEFMVVSIWANIEQLGALLFDVSGRHQYHWGWALLTLCLWMAASIFVLHHRIQGVEVVE